MSMLGTLAKVAMGIAVAKGARSILGKSGGQSGGGLGDMLGGLLGGNNNRTGGTSTSNGGLTDLLGSLVGGVANPQGNTTQEADTSSHGNKSLSDMLGDAFASNKNVDNLDEEEKSKLLLKAMINAAKADGHIDEREQEKITKHLGDITQEELAFVKHELESPLDLDALISSVPSDMANETYLMSLMAIDLDSKEEAQYLDSLAKGLGIDPNTVNKIHTTLNVAPLYS